MKAALLALGLALAVCAVFGRSVGYEFLSLDDGIYVTDNQAVRAGLTAESVKFAFTSFRGGPWHPLTWLSHMLDVELFGLAPAGHHATNVAIHALTTALLFLALRALCGATWTSAFAAALFALHPLRAESVAWVAERKDVIAGLGFATALLAYAGYAKRGGALRMAGVAAAMAFGLMGKPSIVTLPFVLLLLDVWPLRRVDLFAERFPWRRLATLAAEKLPLFALAAGASLLSVVTQGAGGGVATIEEAPLAARLANTLLAYVAYLRKTLWPVDLAVFYPYPTEFPWLRVAAAGALLAGATALALAQLRRRPWLAVGWLWFLGVMVPMVGLVQVGGQALADRYSYLPAIGLSLIVAFAAAELAERLPRARAGIAAACVLLVAASAAATWRQVGYWRNNLTLYRPRRGRDRGQRGGGHEPGLGARHERGPRAARRCARAALGVAGRRAHGAQERGRARYARRGRGRGGELRRGGGVAALGLAHRVPRGARRLRGAPRPLPGRPPLPRALSSGGSAAPARSPRLPRPPGGFPWPPKRARSSGSISSVPTTTPRTATPTRSGRACAARLRCTASCRTRAGSRTGRSPSTPTSPPSASARRCS